MLQTFLAFGGAVIAIFTVIFLFYTNSFLMRRRKKEFGLYNVLGMDKKNLSKILLWETMIMAIITITAGLLVGVLLSKGLQLLILRIFGGAVSLTFTIHKEIILNTVILFVGIFLLLLLHSLWQVARLSPMELMKSESEGEKPPKGNWFLALLGFVLLAVGYGISFRLTTPFTFYDFLFSALAVVLVIMATYLLFIAGSVVFCRIMQKRKGYYYQTKHFISLSSMVYRMKKNGAGLATICVLSTMVLVILSATVCMFAGTDDVLNQQYPRDMLVELRGTGDEQELKETIEMANGILAGQGVEPQNPFVHSYISLFAGFEEGRLYMEETSINMSNTSIVQITPLKNYNQGAKESATLNPGEILLYSGNFDYTHPTISFSFEEEQTFVVKEKLNQFFDTRNDALYMMPVLHLIVGEEDFTSLESVLLPEKSGRGFFIGYPETTYAFDVEVLPQKETEIQQTLEEKLNPSIGGQNTNINVTVKGKAGGKADLFGLNGAIMVLGVFLAIAFSLGAVLTMYYKQVTEGYEDQKRYEILQKVGMTKKEIKKTINSQILITFFLPLVVAGIHLAAAFNLISKVLTLMGIINTALLIKVTVISFAAFALFYALVYRGTSKVYYQIVSNKE